MAYRKTLLEITYHYDDDTGIYQVGEIDFAIHGELENYIQAYGYEGVKDILYMLGHLAYEVETVYSEQKCKERGVNVGLKVEGKGE